MKNKKKVQIQHIPLFGLFHVKNGNNYITLTNYTCISEKHFQKKFITNKLNQNQMNNTFSISL